MGSPSLLRQCSPPQLLWGPGRGVGGASALVLLVRGSQTPPWSPDSAGSGDTCWPLAPSPWQPLTLPRRAQRGGTHPGWRLRAQACYHCPSIQPGPAGCPLPPAGGRGSLPRPQAVPPTDSGPITPSKVSHPQPSLDRSLWLPLTTKACAGTTGPAIPSQSSTDSPAAALSLASLVTQQSLPKHFCCTLPSTTPPSYATRAWGPPLSWGAAHTSGAFAVCTGLPQEEVSMTSPLEPSALLSTNPS